MKANSGLILLSLLLGCDRDASDFLPQFRSTAPPVVEIGELAVIGADDWNAYKGANVPEWPAEAGSSFDAEAAYSFCETVIDPVAGVEGGEGTGGDPRCYYGTVGTGELGVEGGATFTFKGTGGPVCVIVDPETVFWSNDLGVSEDPPGTVRPWYYPDYTSDDGDLDLFGGLSSYYNGSPGVEIGNFKGFYTDSLGRTLEIDYSQCNMFSSVFGIDGQHSGLGSPEYCTIDTALHEGASYTVLMQTFSTPYDDGDLSFGAMVVDGDCQDVMSTLNPSTGETNIVYSPLAECVVRGESQNDGELVECTDKLERAFCVEELQQFCCANPEMCGDYPPEDACAFDFLADPSDVESGVRYGAESREQFCGLYPALCCDG